MTGPLAPLFAQVREGLGDGCAFACGCEDPGNPQRCIHAERFAALSAIERHVQDQDARIAALHAANELLNQEREQSERHVQDMTRWEKIAKDWRYSNEFLGGVVRQTWPAEYPRAALSAREKEEE